MRKRFDTLIEWQLAILLVFMPLAFGVVGAWSEQVVIFLSGTIAISFLLKQVCCGDDRLVWSWAYLPVGVFLLIILLQLTPLPTGFLEVISPNTAALKEKFSGFGGAGSLSGELMRISFYRHATVHDLRLLICAAAVFVVVINVFRRSGQIKRLLMIITCIAGGVGAIAFAQQILADGSIFWSLVNSGTEGYSGPFVCHSHYGQFMNLSIGAGLGWLFVTVHEAFAGRAEGPGEILDRLGSRWARKLWLVVLIIILGVVTVFVSLTRGGMVSLLVAGGVTALLVVIRRSIRGGGWIIAVLAVGAFTCILYTGFEAVHDRLGSLRDVDVYQGRWQILKDLTAAFGQFPVWGTGLGTHSVVYPMFQSINTADMFTHAENEYAQLMEETGLVGVVTLAVLGVIVWAAYWENIRKVKSSLHMAAYGLGFGLMAVMVHSMSDFGQHLAANGFLSAIFCALLISLGKLNRPVSDCEEPMVSGRLRFLSLIVLVCASGVWGWMLIGGNNARLAEKHWAHAVRSRKIIADKEWRGSDSEYADLISHASAACGFAPDNVRYRYLLNLYRCYSIVKAEGRDGESFRKHLPEMREIVDELDKSIELCPTYGPAHSLAGQIEKFIFHNDDGAGRIRLGYELAPCDPVTCFVAGRLDISEGRIEDSVEKFQKSSVAEAGLFREIVAIYVHYLSRPELAIAVAGENVKHLGYVADVLADMQYDDLTADIHQKLTRLLEKICSEKDASARDFARLAGVYRRTRANDKAIEYYHRALDMDYGQVHWRLAMARLLAETGSTAEALQEARICVRLKPQYDPAKKLIDELSVEPTNFD